MTLLAEPTDDPENWRRDHKSALERLGGDEELFLDLAQMCLEDAVQLKATAFTAFASGDQDCAARSVHSIKGLAANFDDRALATTLDRAERLALLGDLSACQIELESAEPRLMALAENLRCILRLERPIVYQLAPREATDMPHPTEKSTSIDRATDDGSPVFIEVDSAK